MKKQKRIVAFVAAIALILSSTIIAGVYAKSYDQVWPVNGKNFDETISDWSFIDSDGDSETWSISENSDMAYEGDKVLVSWSNSKANLDNYAISPKIKVSSDFSNNFKLYYYVSAQDIGYYFEHYSVYIYSGDAELTKENIGEIINSASSNIIKLEERTLSLPKKYERIEHDISIFKDKDVQIIFRHHDCSDQFALKIDSVSVEAYFPETVSALWSFEENEAVADNWTFVDGDGDGFNWGAVSRYNAVDGSNVLLSSSYLGNCRPDNFAISPVVSLNNATEGYLEWYVSPTDRWYYEENYTVYVVDASDNATPETISNKIINNDMMFI